MSVTIQPEQLVDTVQKMMADFALATGEVVDNAAKAAAEHAAETLQATSPSLTGDYAKGWAVKVESKAGNGGHAKVTVYNRTDSRLTHLLEDGHAKVVWGHRTGDRVNPKVHIKPVEAAANAEFLSRVKSG